MLSLDVNLVFIQSDFNIWAILGFTFIKMNIFTALGFKPDFFFTFQPKFTICLTLESNDFLMSNWRQNGARWKVTHILIGWIKLVC